jgi:hypothetical protein
MPADTARQRHAQTHTGPSNVIDEPLTSMPMIVKDLRGPLKKAEALP